MLLLIVFIPAACAMTLSVGPGFLTNLGLLRLEIEGLPRAEAAGGLHLELLHLKLNQLKKIQLRHSLYELPDARKRLAQWIAGFGLNE
jgi:hypothetical protein